MAGTNGNGNGFKTVMYGLITLACASVFTWLFINNQSIANLSEQTTVLNERLRSIESSLSRLDRQQDTIDNKLAQVHQGTVEAIRQIGILETRIVERSKPLSMQGDKNRNHPTYDYSP